VPLPPNYSPGLVVNPTVLTFTVTLPALFRVGLTLLTVGAVGQIEGASSGVGPDLQLNVVRSGALGAPVFDGRARVAPNRIAPVDKRAAANVAFSWRFWIITFLLFR
jgi:hypothetical protein